MALRYQNPVWPGYFADPFVLHWENEYFAYGTGTGLVTAGEGGQRAFTILRSSDLVHWREAGGALAVNDGDGARDFWAPEVAQHEGRFILYYSSAPAGRDELHRIRVAVSTLPTGPFLDGGAVLPDAEGFSIDAHPFRDPRDGRWYLFFAKDYFEGRAGTGLAVVPLSADLLRAAGPSCPVLRACGLADLPARPTALRPHVGGMAHRRGALRGRARRPVFLFLLRRQLADPRVWRELRHR